jgi:hypothetical protein
MQQAIADISGYCRGQQRLQVPFMQQAICGQIKIPRSLNLPSAG